jgi:flagellar basal body-associated protein FliL
MNVLVSMLAATCFAAAPAFAQDEPAGDAPPPPVSDTEAEAEESDDASAADPTEPPATAEPAEPAATDAAAADTTSGDATGLRTADEAYQLKVKQLESDINELKERIFRSKAKLTLLTEQVTGGAGTGASAVIAHKWEMGGAFRLSEVHYFIDGAPIWQDVDEGGKRLSKLKRKQLFDGNLVEGSHTLSVKLVLRGNGSGVFSYIDDFSWTIQDKYTFTAEPGKVHAITVVAYEKGNFTTDLKDKPSLRFDVDVQVDTKKAKGKNEADEKTP